MGKPSTAVRDCTASVEAAAKNDQDDHALPYLSKYRGACATAPRAATSRTCGSKHYRHSWTNLQANGGPSS
ncbi:Hypothetical protein FKW44_022821 [Caligus rogercresseyi]|uniref:Uncharacterized protein n=1 Tax=Caligus rogercresseyi TaxID=217165 RepID=A0A7T8GNI5_CALRO|nr:Hypothetical protein FKW44_022821 [Caligus rogercresseyi]